MTSRKHYLADSLFMVMILIAVFLVNLFLVGQFGTKTMTPMIFVLGVFLVSWRTQGYFWGIAASLISVLAVNWAWDTGCWMNKQRGHRSRSADRFTGMQTAV